MAKCGFLCEFLLVVICTSLFVCLATAGDKVPQQIMSDHSDMSTAGELVFSGLGEKRADTIAFTDMSAYENTMQCNFSDMHPTVKYNESVTLPVPGDDFWAIVQEYMEVVRRLKTNKELLGQDFDAEQWLSLDTDDLYKNFTNANERKRMFSTVGERVNDQTSDDIIQMGINIALSHFSNKLSNDFGNSGHVGTSDEFHLNESSDFEPDSRSTEQIEQDNIEELCEEFPEEPECSE